MTKIQQVLDSKSATQLWSVSPQQSVFEAIQIMADQKVGALLVFDNQQLNGIITERDYARKVITQGKSSRTTQVHEIMTADVKQVTPNDSIDYCLNLMTDHYIRHLPVTNNEKVIGIVSIGDLVKAKIQDQQAMIEQLEHYIHQ
ncbi:CBS domain-containing protein [Marinicella sp. W31]|uniref:CBS domain-containing protein n=1 Tax=Marinicella sp. W31 TaxID=3023713 RepID=UPI0037574D23